MAFGSHKSTRKLKKYVLQQFFIFNSQKTSLGRRASDGQNPLGSAKSASQRALASPWRAMRATVQMLRIFICFIYIRVRKFWTHFFSLFFSFCYNFGENFAYSKSPKMRKKIKRICKNLLRFKTSEKKIRENHTAAPLLE